MIKRSNIQSTEIKSFINREKLYQLIDDVKNYSNRENIDKIIEKSFLLKGLNLEEVAILLNTEDDFLISKILDAASKVKELIYGKRLVIFAPLYIGNICSNNCLYCAFRKDNHDLKRAVLNFSQIEMETQSLLKQGHKRILMLCGESEETNLDYFCEAIRRIYSQNYNGNNIRRINVEIAPLSVDGFKKLYNEKIGTYACFQETYDEVLYKKYHPEGPKQDYLNRLFVMDRAMEAGIDDVGIGVLFGLADYKFEVLSLIEHARHLEEKFGTGPHTVSVPRIEPAVGAPLSYKIPYPVSDKDFKKIIAIIRLSLPYTGIILSTRENETLRKELFHYGVSQISAGSRTNPGAYSHTNDESTAQFQLGDHRSLEEVISALIDDEFIPSFCTACYRKGRVGKDFMDLAKPGLIQKFCMPNGILTFAEYLISFASEKTKKKGFKLIEKLISKIKDENQKKKIKIDLERELKGQMDVYY
ncbi:MAG: [FeFe] hydrogenase H-cluster radical SAM maturase HydG [Exilispira sp.]